MDPGNRRALQPTHGSPRILLTDPRFARRYWWINIKFNGLNCLCLSLSRFARGNWWTKISFSAPRFARGDGLIEFQKIRMEDVLYSGRCVILYNLYNDISYLMFGLEIFPSWLNLSSRLNSHQDQILKKSFIHTKLWRFLNKIWQRDRKCHLSAYKSATIVEPTESNWNGFF